MRLLVGGVGQLFQGDFDVGRVVAERIAADNRDGQVIVEDLHYGAVAVLQRIEDVAPDALILVGSEQRGKAPGQVSRWLADMGPIDPEQAQVAVEGAVVGYVSIDLILGVLRGLNTSPPRAVVFGIEPQETGPAADLSPTVKKAVEEAVTAIQREVLLTPLFILGTVLRSQQVEFPLAESPASKTMEQLFAALEGLETDGKWGRTFGLKDRLRLQISAGETPEGIGHLDWSLWWGLIEELDRLQALMASTVEHRRK